MPWHWFPEGPDNIVASLRRAKITKTDDAGDDQLVDLTGLASETFTKVMRAMPHGLASNAPDGSLGLLLALGGRSDRAVLIGGEHYQYRQKNLPAGTAVLYDDKGNVVFVKGSDGIAVHAKQGKVYVKPADGQNVYLGGDGTDGAYSKVVTDAGPSMNVLARIG